MNTKLISELTSEYKKAKHPSFKVGDMLEVHEKIKEGGKERVQIFRGVVIAVKGSGVSKTFTIRKISYGIGVEKIYPLFSPNISKIKVVKKADKIRRSKLYYLRERIGKQALKAGTQIPVEGEDLETKFEEEVKEKEEKAEGKEEKEKEENSKQKTEQKEDSKDAGNGEEKKKDKNEGKKDSEQKAEEKK